ncbi:MAG: transposase [Thermodesulfobacteriota bacterium]
MIKRKPNRLGDYDYSQDGYYFITICTQNREEWFGKIEKEQKTLNGYGEVAKDFWVEIPPHFDDVKIDEFTIMPNHMHGILIVEKNRVGNAYMRSLQDRTKMLLSKTVQQFKSSVTRKIHSIQNDFKFQWQKSFYDHIIRNEKSLSHVRQYIVDNPLKWDLDRENPLSKNFNLDKDLYWKEMYDQM